MPYILKPNQPAFDVVDGPFAGKKFRHETPYTDIPPGDAAKFTKSKTPPAAKTANPTEDTAKNKGVSEVDPGAPVKAPGKKGGAKS